MGGGDAGACFVSSRRRHTRCALATGVQTCALPIAAVYYLSGLTCTEENFTVKAGAQRMAAEAGLILVAPDTSPRGDGVANAPDYDLGPGAGFYVDSTMQPWAKHFKMYSSVTRELPELIAELNGKSVGWGTSEAVRV